MTESELERLRTIEQSVILFESKINRQITQFRAEITGYLEEIKRQLRQLRNLSIQDEEQ